MRIEESYWVAMSCQSGRCPWISAFHSEVNVMLRFRHGPREDLGTFYVIQPYQRHWTSGRPRPHPAGISAALSASTASERMMI